MRFRNYHLENPSAALRRKISKYNTYEQKIEIWNAFIDSGLSEITEDDFSILPRVIPQSYWPAIQRSAFLITKFALSLLSLPEKEVRAILPPGPISDHLLNDLEVLRYRNGRITGSFRFDMAISDPPHPQNPPVLLEINEIGFDGLARSSFFQRTLLEKMPELKTRLKMLDTAAAEVRNMQRLGRKIARIQYDSYNWDEEYLLRTAEQMDSDIQLVCPAEFGLEVNTDDFPLLRNEFFRLKNGRVRVGKSFIPDAMNMSFAYSLEDYVEGHKLYRRLIRAKTPQYGPFLTGLVASKTILVLLDDPGLRRKLLGNSAALSSSVLPAHLLSEELSSELLKRPADWVIKHADGSGGEQVFMDQELVKRTKAIPKKERHEWVLQQKTKLNLIDVNGLLSRPKKAISDLGVFVQYDWKNGKFQHFEVGGLMCRATNKSLKVNVSGGGLQVAVLLDKKS